MIQGPIRTSAIDRVSRTEVLTLLRDITMDPMTGAGVQTLMTDAGVLILMTEVGVLT